MILTRRKWLIGGGLAGGAAGLFSLRRFVPSQAHAAQTLAAYNNIPINGSMAMYLNGTKVTNPLKVSTWTGTTSAAGTATINISAIGYTTIIGQPIVNAQGTGPYTTNATSFSTTSVSILIYAGTIISILGTNIISLGGAAVPYSVTIFGY